MERFTNAEAAAAALPRLTPIVLARPHVAQRRAHAFLTQFPGQTSYAVKANPAPWLLDALAQCGVTQFDVASLPEMAAVRAAAPNATFAHTHPVKPRETIAAAYHDYGCRIFTVDCADELAKLTAVLGGIEDLTVFVRLTVSNEAAALPITGKFGASDTEAAALFSAISNAGGAAGAAFHVGSQCLDPQSYVGAIGKTAALSRRAGVRLTAVTVGGGFPAAYPGGPDADLQPYFSEIHRAFSAASELSSATLWCEPGRALAAPAASLIATVELRKGDDLYLNDGGFGVLFDAAHVGWRFPVRRLGDASPPYAAAARGYRFFGPTCDAMDVMTGPFTLPDDMAEGDQIEIGMVGAYGAVMASSFNGFGVYQHAIAEDDPWSCPADQAACAITAKV